MSHSVLVWRAFDRNDHGGSSDSSQFPSNKRLYPRYLIPQDGLSYIELDSGRRAMVADISYGGISARFEDDKFFRQIAESLYAQKPIEVELQMFNKSMKCNMVPVFRENDNLGLCFRHDSSEELVFLKNVISTLQVGVDLGNQEPQVLSSSNDFEYEAVNETGLIGEIAIEQTDYDEPNYRVVYRDGNIHYSLFIDRGHLVTAQTIGMGGVLTSLTPTVRLDKRILRGAAMVLAGSLSVADHQQVEELYDRLVRSLVGGRQRLDIAG